MNDKMKITALLLTALMIVSALTALGMCASASGSGTRGSAPVINFGGVMPSSGNTTTSFMFIANYRDADNDAISKFVVNIDGGNNNLNWSGTNYAGGINGTCTMMFSAGNHTYHFFALNVLNETVRYPSSGNLTLYVSQAPPSHKPELYSPMWPSNPRANQTMNFTITYKDLDDQAPSYVQFYMKSTDTGANVVNMTMHVVGTAYTTGVTCYATLAVSEGNYSYFFLAQSGSDVVRYPASGHLYIYVGVANQSNRAPYLMNGVVYPTSGQSNQTLFTYKVLYTDADNDAPTIKNIILDGKTYAMSLSGNATYMSGATFIYYAYLLTGTHSYAFHFCDGHYNATLPTSGSYTGPTVNTNFTNSPPTASLHINGPGACVNQTVYFNLSAQDADNDPLTIKWKFSDGYTASNTTTVKRVFARSGNYTATCVVTDPYGASVTVTGTIYIKPAQGGNQNNTNSAPVLRTNLNSVTKVLKGSSLYISASGTTDPDGDKLTYTWTLSDQNGNKLHTTTLVSFNFTFNALGNHSLKLSVSDGKLSSSASFIIYVYQGSSNNTNIAPVAIAYVKTWGMMACFDGSRSYDPDGKIVSYVWAVDSTTYSGAYYNYTYKTSGNKTASLKVTDNGGLSSSYSLSFYISSSSSNGNNSGHKNITDDSVGADVKVDSSENGTYVDVIYSEQGFKLEIIGFTDGKLTFTVESDSANGKLVILRVEKDDFNIKDPIKMIVTMDGAKVVWTDYETIAKATGTTAMFCIVVGDGYYEILVYVPHFSKHTIEVSNPEEDVDEPVEYDALLFWSGLIAVIVITAIIVIVLVFMQMKRKKEQEYYSDFAVGSDRTSRGDGVKIKTGYIEESGEDEEEYRRHKSKGSRDDEYWDDFL